MYCVPYPSVQLGESRTRSGQIIHWRYGIRRQQLGVERTVNVMKIHTHTPLLFPPVSRAPIEWIHRCTPPHTQPSSSISLHVFPVADNFFPLSFVLVFTTRTRSSAKHSTQLTMACYCGLFFAHNDVILDMVVYLLLLLFREIMSVHHHIVLDLESLMTPNTFYKAPVGCMRHIDRRSLSARSMLSTAFATF